MRRSLSLILGIALLVGCRDDQPLATEPNPAAPSLDIVDAARNGGSAGFYFLSPIAAGLASYPGSFDDGASAVVEVCRWTGTSCDGAPVARYTRTEGTGGARLQVIPTMQHYRVDWPTTGLATGSVFRIQVLVGGIPLGFADAKVPGAGETAVSVKAAGYVPIGNSSSLPIRFRIERGAPMVEAGQALPLARALLTSSDRVAAFRALSAEVDRWVATGGVAAARERLRALSLYGFNAVTDWQAIRDFHLAMGGQILSESTASGVLSIGPAAGATQAAPPTAGQTVVVYVNGILTDVTGLLHTRLLLRDMLRSMGWDVNQTGSPYRLHAFYNRTFASSLNQQSQCSLFGSLALGLLGKPWSAIADYLTSCVGPGVDLGESARQLFQQMGTWETNIEPDAAQLAGIIRDELRLGNRVIVVAHSQGNLMLQQALSQITEGRQCLGVVSLAAPSSVWPNDIELASALVGGEEASDMIAGLGLNATPRTATQWTRAIDQSLRRIRQESGVFDYVNALVFESIFLHYIDDSYIGGDATNAYIQASLRAHDGRLQDKCAATAKGVMRNLGTLGGGTFSQGEGVNNAGQVVGMANTAAGQYRAFLFTPGSGMVDLGTPPGHIQSLASAINEAGQAVGYSLGPTGTRASLWTPGRGMVDLGTLPGYSTSRALDINNAGQVVGFSYNGESEMYRGHAFLWTPETGMVDLGTLPGTVGSIATGINSHGHVVGWSIDDAGRHSRAFFWAPGSSGLFDLSTLLPGSHSSDAMDINDAAQFVGGFRNAAGQFHAFRFSPGSGLVDIGKLPGDVLSYAHGINAAGHVVGVSINAAGGERAFLWTSQGGIVDLGNLGSTRASASARGINDAGQVVGSSATQTGLGGAFLWTPGEYLTQAAHGLMHSAARRGARR